MAVRLKTPEQIERMRRSGQLVRRVLNRLGEMIAPGVTTKELDDEAERICTEAGARCLFKGVPSPSGGEPFPGSICSSINEQIVHGIPSDDIVVEDGDIVSVDFGVELDGWCGDAAETFAVGAVDEETRRLVSVTRNALGIAVTMSRPGEVWSNVARAMQEYVEGEGFSVVREFVGHGIGQEMHEDPKVPNYVSRDLRMRDIPLRPGLVIAVEPMVNAGTYRTEYGPDGWTILTQDGKPSAHFEHTLAIVEDGVAVLTGDDEE